MTLWSNNQCWEHKHSNRLRGGYFGELLVFKIWSLPPGPKYVSGILAEQVFIWSNIWRGVKKQWAVSLTYSNTLDCLQLAKLSLLPQPRWIPWLWERLTLCFFSTEAANVGELFTHLTHLTAKVSKLKAPCSVFAWKQRDSAYMEFPRYVGATMLFTCHYSGLALGNTWPCQNAPIKKILCMIVNQKGGQTT